MASHDRVVRPVISSGEYSYEHIDVASQRHNPDSLLSWMERAIRTRRECPEFGRGSVTIIETNSPSVFAHCCEWQGSRIMAVHNLLEQQAINLNLSGYTAERLVDLKGSE
jgi:maltose alpha-D-glucosyltransferase / alpha-amylase